MIEGLRFHVPRARSLRLPWSAVSWRRLCIGRLLSAVYRLPSVEIGNPRSAIGFLTAADAEQTDGNGLGAQVSGPTIFTAESAERFAHVHQIWGLGSGFWISACMFEVRRARDAGPGTRDDWLERSGTPGQVGS